jgi:hypothetical protein
MSSEGLVGAEGVGEGEGGGRIERSLPAEARSLRYCMAGVESGWPGSVDRHHGLLEDKPRREGRVSGSQEVYCGRRRAGRLGVGGGVGNDALTTSEK